MSEMRRFHPLAIVIYFINYLRTWFFLIAISFFYFQKNIGLFWLGLFALMVLLLGIAALKYLTSKYEISEAQLIFSAGLFNKTNTTIPYDRIQTLKTNQWVYLRPFHLVDILIETASSGPVEPEITLTAVPEKLVELIERYRVSAPNGNLLQPEKQLTNQIVDQQAAQLGDLEANQPKLTKSEVTHRFQVSLAQILLFGGTDLHVFIAGMAVLGTLGQYIPKTWENFADQQMRVIFELGWLVVTVFGVFVILLLAVISIGRTLIQYFHFTVQRVGKQLTIEKGLLNRHIQKVPLDKIQGIVISQQLLRHVFKLSSVQLILAGGQGDEDANSSQIYLLPIIKDQELDSTLTKILPEWNYKIPTSRTLKQASPWYFMRWSLVFGAALTVIAAFFNGYAALGVGILAAFFVFTSYLDYRSQAYVIQSPSRIWLQNVVFLTKRQFFIERPKIQALTASTTINLQKKHISHIKLKVKEGIGDLTVKLRYLDESEIEKVRDYYLQGREF
ncbi:PH domain-containing protein [Pediococcus siamensis]|uniref:PH domain-containing protein n=1 Tax=Pediococcus siamensis TaxID=381829 RepID=UPI00399F5609